MASYTGSDKRLQYLFEHGGGGGADIWTGTQAEYTQQASQIEDGTLVNITDDEGFAQIWDIYPTDDTPIIVGKYGNRDVKRKRLTVATLATGQNNLSGFPSFDILMGYRGYVKTNETSPRYMQINSDINSAGWYASIFSYKNGNGYLFVGSPFNGGSAEFWIDYVEASS